MEQIAQLKAMRDAAKARLMTSPDWKLMVSLDALIPDLEKAFGVTSDPVATEEKEEEAGEEEPALGGSAAEPEPLGATDAQPEAPSLHEEPDDGTAHVAAPADGDVAGADREAEPAEQDTADAALREDVALAMEAIAVARADLAEIAPEAQAAEPVAEAAAGEPEAGAPVESAPVEADALDAAEPSPEPASAESLVEAEILEAIAADAAPEAAGETGAPVEAAAPAEPASEPQSVEDLVEAEILEAVVVDALVEVPVEAEATHEAAEAEPPARTSFEFVEAELLEELAALAETPAEDDPLDKAFEDELAAAADLDELRSSNGRHEAAEGGNGAESEEDAVKRALDELSADLAAASRGEDEKASIFTYRN